MSTTKRPSPRPTNQERLPSPPILWFRDRQTDRRQATAARTDIPTEKPHSPQPVPRFAYVGSHFCNTHLVELVHFGKWISLVKVLSRLGEVPGTSAVLKTQNGGTHNRSLISTRPPIPLRWVGVCSTSAKKVSNPGLGLVWRRIQVLGLRVFGTLIYPLWGFFI